MRGKRLKTKIYHSETQLTRDFFLCHYFLQLKKIFFPLILDILNIFSVFGSTTRVTMAFFLFFKGRLCKGVFYIVLQICGLVQGTGHGQVARWLAILYSGILPTPSSRLWQSFIQVYCLLPSSRLWQSFIQVYCLPPSKRQWQFFIQVYCLPLSNSLWQSFIQVYCLPPSKRQWQSFIQVYCLPPSNSLWHSFIGVLCKCILPSAIQQAMAFFHRGILPLAIFSRGTYVAICKLLDTYLIKKIIS